MEESMQFSVFESLPRHLALIKANPPEFTIVAVTQEFVKAAGIAKENMKNKSYFSSFPEYDSSRKPDHNGAMRASFLKLIKDKIADQLPDLRYDLPGKDGSFKENYWQILNKPVLDETGAVSYIIQDVLNISEEIKAGKKLSRLKEIEKVNDLFGQAPVAVCILTGKDYVVEMVNEGMLEFLGRTKSIIGKPIIQSLTEADKQGLISILNQVSQTGQPYYGTAFPAIILINGVRELRYFDLVFKPYYLVKTDYDVTSIFCVAHNVTAQVAAMQKMEEEKERTSLAMEVGGLGMIEIDLQTNSVQADQRCLEICNISHASTFAHFENIIFPEDRAVIIQSLEEGKKTGKFDYEVRLLVTDGKQRWIRSRGIIYKDKEGRLLRAFGIVQDITEQKIFTVALNEKVEQRTGDLEHSNAALLQANSELARSNANLEEFAYAASHDLKEPVRKINYFSERLKQELAHQLNQEQTSLFDRMDKAARRMGLLIDDLLQYSHVSKGLDIEETIDLNQKLSLVLEDLELEIQQKKAKITVGQMPIIKGHRRQLQQLFQNLISNALKYSQPEKPVEINIRSRLISAEELTMNFPGKENNISYNEIEVADNGIGFAQEDAERIFNVFTRLHGINEYAGTGVGLSIVKKVVDNHKGYIWAESEPGKGAKFKVLLPESRME